MNGERILASCSEQWDAPTYIANYLRTRQLPATWEQHERIAQCLAQYPGATPVTKSELDFYLDANLHRPVRSRDQ